MLARASVWTLAVIVLAGACGAPTATQPPPSPGSPATPAVTERPSPPAGLAQRGADAPRNVPDPCALLDAGELETILGMPATVAERAFVGDDDAWRCDLFAAEGTSGVTVALYVNAAQPGWTEHLVGEDGATSLDLPDVVGVRFETGGIAVELGQHVVVLVHGTDHGPGPNEPLTRAATGMVGRQKGQD